MSEQCQQCGERLEILRHPLRRLRWTRYWWHGLASLMSQPLRFCQQCGTIYTHSGRLLATGAAETSSEIKVRGFHDDMANLRDGFGTVFIASEITVVWTLIGPGTYPLSVSILAGTVGALALVPTAFFGIKARRARKEVKRLRVSRLKGELAE